jgi:hypothetical protein
MLLGLWLVLRCSSTSSMSPPSTIGSCRSNLPHGKLPVLPLLRCRQC